MDTVRIYQCDEFDFSSTGRLGVEIGSCWRAGFSNLAKRIKWVLETLGYALSSGNVPTTSNIISRGGYSAFVGAVRPAAPTIPSLQIMHL